MNVRDGLAFLDLTAELCEQPQMQEELQAWMQTAKQELGSHIESQKSPDGMPYIPLAKSTIKRKGHDTALLRTGELIKSVVGNGSGHIEEAVGNMAILGTSHEKNGKPIALFLQEGTKRNGKQLIPPRPFIGVTDAMANNAAELIADGLIADIDSI